MLSFEYFLFMLCVLFQDFGMDKMRKINRWQPNPRLSLCHWKYRFQCWEL